MRRLLLVVVLLAATTAATTARASGGAVIMIPLLLAAQLIGAVTAPFRCHPQDEKIDLDIEAMEIDGVPVAPADPAGPYYVAAYEGGRVVAALADPTSEPPGAARAHALVVPGLQP